MDLADSLRSEDFTRTDFFDFVSCPDLNDGQRNKCFGGFSSENSDMDSTLDDLKEANNNHVVSNGDCLQLEQLWGGSGLDKDVKSEKMDYVLLDDLSSYLTSVPVDDNKTKTTDGAIYTVTILNQDNGWGVLKNDDITVDSHQRQDVTAYVPTSIQLDVDTSSAPSGNQELESLFHIIATVPPVTNGLDHNGVVKDMFSELNGHQNGDEHLNGDVSFQYATLANTKYTSPETPTTVDSLTTASSCSTIVLHPSPSQSDSSSSQSPLLEHNRGWITISTPSDSLLRSALQGKSNFQQQKDQLSSSNTSPQQSTDSNSELRRALSAPPGNNPQYNPLSPAMSSPYSGYNGNSKDILLNGNGSSDSLYPSDDSPTPLIPTTIDQSGPLPSMDELILTHLDTFTGDYEKLRRIEKEVAESTKQFCNGTTTITNNTNGATMYLHEMAAADMNQNVYLQGPADVTVLLSPPTPSAQTSATVTIATPSTNGKNKKYSRRQNGKNSPAASTTTANLNGIRKERSLHYCTICNKGFKDKYSVNVHIRTHTGEKPFSCSLCGKNFRQKAHLAKHFQTHSQKAGSQPKSIKR